MKMKEPRTFMECMPRGTSIKREIVRWWYRNALSRLCYALFAVFILILIAIVFIIFLVVAVASFFLVLAGMPGYLLTAIPSTIGMWGTWWIASYTVYGVFHDFWM